MKNSKKLGRPFKYTKPVKCVTFALSPEAVQMIKKIPVPEGSSISAEISKLIVSAFGKLIK